MSRDADPLNHIGNTPLIELTRLDAGPCRLFVKLENQNPSGSIKDRIALSMIEAAEADGRLKPGGQIVEATAGNTGLALALLAIRRGYRLTLVIPDKMSREKIAHLRAMGVEVVLTRSDVAKGHPEYYQDLAERIARETGAFFADQFNNPANPAAHETTTGPEIWEQTGGAVDAVVAGVGSGGTLTGLSRFFARVSPTTDIVLADPKGSILAEYTRTGEVGTAGSWLVEGIGEDFIPPVSDLSRVKHAYTITDGESFAVARQVLRDEGLLIGSSSGTLLAAALRYCREQTTPKRVVTFVCDSGNKYLSKMYNDFWMADQGLLTRPRHGDLRDIISRRHDEGAVVTVAPEDSLLVAYQRMKLHDVSQVPVLAGDQCVGMLDESDVLIALGEWSAGFDLPVRVAMTGNIETVGIDTPPERLLPLFDRGWVAIVVDGERFLGLITRIDLLNHLRRKVAA
ncbi:pyridoxal-phosphate dependent enzyme [Magnetospirillum fulvum]|uniref:Cysteine synthase B n=1 Tax=Magnetospirillum fulvum MGU-K5 TaxID=1316936 RepID=S9TK30_MAGFU|nr:cystathionine beta-synthase [Magnetospirillum fulvum]EPY02626.1 pyridoxal-5'-phosphate-dependent protein subunit beta [Magnetospirillum fulvum MGU-K5]